MNKFLITLNTLLPLFILATSAFFIALNAINRTRILEERISKLERKETK